MSFIKPVKQFLLGWINSSAFLSVLDSSLFLSSKNADEFFKVQGHCVIWKQIWLLYDFWLTKLAKCKFCSSLFHALEGTSGTLWKSNKNMRDLNRYIITSSAWPSNNSRIRKKLLILAKYKLVIYCAMKRKKKDI